jgi:1,5-anhydro-D-fructose reductase (1,5-anhydro-D-mannitol-forming)
VTIGWAIVGTGWAASDLVGPAITADTQSELVAVVSRDAARAQAFAIAHGAERAYSDYESMLNDPRVEIVYIGTPNALHAEQTIAAAKAGKHILCDKPLATSPSDARRVVETCRNAHVWLGVNFQCRHYAAIQEIKQIVDRGEIGDIELVHAESGAGHSPLRGWRTDSALSGMGTVNNMAVHPLDLVCYLVGAGVSEVFAMTDAGRTPALETIALTLLRFDNGVLANVNANQQVPFPQSDIVVYGSRGTIVGRNCTYFPLDSTITLRTPERETRIGSHTRDGFQRAVTAFRQAVATGTTPNASGEDGLRSALLVDAIRTSLREGRAVHPTAAGAG